MKEFVKLIGGKRGYKNDFKCGHCGSKGSLQLGKDISDEVSLESSNEPRWRIRCKICNATYFSTKSSVEAKKLGALLLGKEEENA